MRNFYNLFFRRILINKIVSVAIRILNIEKKIAMDWTFIEISYSSLTYKDLLKNILSGEFPECEVKKCIFPCTELVTLYGLSSTSHKDIEKIKGGPETDIVQKENKFSMLYFSIFQEIKRKSFRMTY